MTISPCDHSLSCDQELDFTTRILIVDDDPLILRLLETSLRSFGHECEQARDGLEAVDKLDAGSFSIVITDMTMPRMDGMELLRYIKTRYPRIEVIVITGFTETYSYTDVIKAGACDFLSKPFNVDELEAKLRRVIREQRLIRKLERLSMYDALTDLYNRRAFDRKLQEELARSQRQGYPVFLAMIDIDGFKNYNDRFGHPAGDEVLQEVARTLLLHTRQEMDWCFRQGGDEFALLLPDTTVEQALHVGRRILEHYRQTSYGQDTSLSIGLAQFHHQSDRSWRESIEDVVHRADQALYHSKQQGGDRISTDDSLTGDA